MTDNTKSIVLKLQEAKRNHMATGHSNRVFLGHCIYAEFDVFGVKLTYEDGSGCPVDTIRLGTLQLVKFVEAIEKMVS